MCTLCRGEADRERDRTRAADLAQLFLGEMSPRKRFLFVEFFFFFFLRRATSNVEFQKGKKKEGGVERNRAKKIGVRAIREKKRLPLSLSLSLSEPSLPPRRSSTPRAQSAFGEPLVASVAFFGCD